MCMPEIASTNKRSSIYSDHGCVPIGHKLSYTSCNGTALVNKHHLRNRSPWLRISLLGIESNTPFQLVFLFKLWVCDGESNHWSLWANNHDFKCSWHVFIAGACCLSCFTRQQTQQTYNPWDSSYFFKYPILDWSIVPKYVQASIADPQPLTRNPTR